MTVITSPEEFTVEDLFIDLGPLFGPPLHLKCEGFNFAGSIKLKAAVEMVAAAERDGLLRPGMTIVESSSGNLGIALGMVAATHGYRFVCVTDARCSPRSRQLMECYGAEVVVVTEPDPERGLLGARIDRVAALCADRDDVYWPNQYANPANWVAHHGTTGPEIAKAFPDVSVVFVGAGTTGTLMGCARYFRERNPAVEVVGVDAVGSVAFGGPAGRRLIPGIGTGVRPSLLDESLVADHVLVSEQDTVRACRALLGAGFLFGGSTGTVVAGAARWLSERPDPDRGSAVAIAPDLGMPYLDTVYRDEWVAEHYGSDVLDPGGSRRSPGRFPAFSRSI